MFFGLMNSLSTFQTIMNDIFHDLIMEGVVCVYLDDILIFSKTLEEQHWITQIVLELVLEGLVYWTRKRLEMDQTRTTKDQTISPVFSLFGFETAKKPVPQDWL
jgi:hypothetical protein